jgi:hypothetical protein
MWLTVTVFPVAALPLRHFSWFFSFGTSANVSDKNPRLHALSSENIRLPPVTFDPSYLKFLPPE